MYAFARRPKWVVSHMLVISLIVAMIAMGLWQLDRLSGRKDANALVVDRLSEPVDDITTLTVAGGDYDVGEQLRYRRATATGTYDAEAEVLVRNRSLNGSPGYWALTPLVLDDGSAVAVNRGWVPFSPGPGEPRPDSLPPAGTVVVTGLVRQTVTAEGLQRDDPDEGQLDSLARPDLARLEQQLDYPLLPVYLQLEAQAPESESALPIPLPRPDLDEGPHLAYAVQWFVFTTIAVIGYPLVLRRVAMSDGGAGRHSDIPVDYL